MDLIFSIGKHIVEFIFSTGKTSVEFLLAKSSTFTTLHFYLVKHPKIQSFEWRHGRTRGSSFTFLTLTVFLYLSLTFVLSRRRSMVRDTGRNPPKSEKTLNGHDKVLLQSRSGPPLVPPLSSNILRLLTALHNTILLTVSFVMALGCTLSIFTHLPNVDHLACFAKGTPPRGPLFFWAYVFYLSKIYEYVDTLLIILSSSMTRRLSFLHVYHHATVVVMCYISLHTSQSMYPGVLVTNSAVHVVMYFYYLLCSLGMKPKWKKIVTDCQIVQFYTSFGIMGWIFYVHFTGSGCSGIWGWCFDALFIASLLYLFLDFHAKTYSQKKVIGQLNGVEVFDFIKPLKQA